MEEPEVHGAGPSVPGAVCLRAPFEAAYEGPGGGCWAIRRRKHFQRENLGARRSQVTGPDGGDTHTLDWSVAQQVM